MSEQQSTHDGNWYVLLFGIDLVEDAYSLGSGLAIRSIEPKISVFDLAQLGAAGFRQWAMLEPLAGGCGAEIESARDAAIIPGYDTMNRAWLASALISLGGHPQHLPVAASTYSWRVVAGHNERTSGVFREVLEREGLDAAVFGNKRDLPPFTGQLLDYHTQILVPDTAELRPFSEEDAAWIQDHFEAFNQIASDSDSFRFALEAAVDWRFQTSIGSAIARLWAGIEAIFGVSSELVFRISLLAACLLEVCGDSRAELFKEVKKLYGLRSKVVHGEQVSPEKMHYAMSGSYSLLRRLLLLAIERGHALGNADFDQAMFS